MGDGLHGSHAELGIQLFSQYVRDVKLLQQLRQSLHLYEVHGSIKFAEWAIESMYLVSVSLDFETKVLDIAYLLLLKIMKEESFKMHDKFIKLYLKVLTKQGKFKEAIDFIDMNSTFFEGNKIEKQIQEASLFHDSGNPVLTINVLFNMLRTNSNVHQYKELWDVYRKCIRIVLDNYLPNSNYVFMPTENFAEIGEDTANKDKEKTKDSNINFDTKKVGVDLNAVVRTLFSSLVNIREQAQ